jgi:peptidoglycan-N-acetylglucosamine deacetylase
VEQRAGHSAALRQNVPMSQRFIHTLIWALMLFATVAEAQSVAITLDDGPRLATTPLMSPVERNQALLDALKKRDVQATLFVTVNYGADRPEGLALARAWGEAGHTVGNHTMTHLDLNRDDVSLERYQRELQDTDAVIRTLPGYRKWFRFTFLREGNTPQKRDGMRAFLKAQGYRNAYVSLDTSDWRLDEALLAALKKDAQADLAPIKAAYLAHLRQRAEAYRELAFKLQGRDVPQVLLLHHNLINALWLGDVIDQFRAMGWTITTPEQALADPMYALQPDRDVPGQSLLLAMARSLGVPRPANYERLVDDGDFEIEQLRGKKKAP